LLDKPAQPAKVDMQGGHLTIQANNSSLSEILHQVTTSSGMTVEGLGPDQRIFGSYGPGDPSEVLLSLLHGSGYNVIMVGQTADGAPRQLTLSPRGAGATNSGPSRPAPANQDDSDDDAQSQPAPDTTPPPAPAQAAPTYSPQNGPRTPQQMLQELQQMRQQQQQQQQQPQ
jgi:hypothetical protein